MARLLGEDRIVFGADDRAPNPGANTSWTRCAQKGCHQFCEMAHPMIGGSPSWGSRLTIPNPSVWPRRLCVGLRMRTMIWSWTFSQGRAPLATPFWLKIGERNTRLQFILVQKPEPVGTNTAAEKAGFTSVFDMTRTRLQRAIGIDGCRCIARSQ